MIERLHLRAAWPCYAHLAVGALLDGAVPVGAAVHRATALMSTLSLSPTLAILVGIRRYRPAHAGAWTWLAVGQALFFLGDLYTYAYPKLFHHEVPFPSMGDGLYLLVYPALMAGLLLRCAGGRPRATAPGSSTR